MDVKSYLWIYQYILYGVFSELLGRLKMFTK